ncbi:MAG: GreA/GreB family elongation factor [Marinilabiliales bacterium]|nr:GreA/GreB family elongation factor [Marinilabiliales bacterium]
MTAQGSTPQPCRSLTGSGSATKETGTTMEYQLVPESEANLKEGKIAATSPIAQGIMGRKVGECG